MRMAMQIDNVAFKAALSLFADAADPEKYQWELSQERSTTSKRAGINHVVERSSSLPSIVDSRLVEQCEKVQSLREQFFPLLQNSLPSSITASL